MTPPPLPQGDLSNTTSTSNSSENGNGNSDNASDTVQAAAEELRELHLRQAPEVDDDVGAASRATNGGAAQLPLPLPPHALSLSDPRPHLPCPFTVLQGIPGDGMANTIDSAPLMECHGGGSGSGNANSRRGSAVVPTLAIAEVVEEEEEEEDDEPEEKIETSASRQDGDGGDSTAEDIAADAGADDIDDDDEKLEERASAAMAAATEAESTSTPQQSQSQQRQRPRSRSFEAMAVLENEAHRTTEGGLHLPIPPSLGISAHLPPLVPAPAPARARAEPPSTRARDPSDTSTTTSTKVDGDPSSPSSPSSPNVNLSRAERRAVRAWEVECRERERRQREETLLELRQRQITTASFANTNTAATTGNRNADGNVDGNADVDNAVGNEDNTPTLRSHNVGSDEFPYARNGRLAVFASLPTRSEGGNRQGSWGTIQGDLAPGGAVDAVDVVALDPETFHKVEDGDNLSGTDGLLLFLAITAPVAGFVLYRKEDGSTLLGCGQPSHWAQPDAFIWRVCCPDGALIRDGLELTAAHVQTVPHGSFVKVTGKTVNSMGLGRLRVEAVLDGGSCTDAGADHDVEARTVTGWISEALNPLSGQRGPVVQPVPLPAPLQCRIIFAEGATIRRGIELSSAEVGHAPAGAVITVVGRAFSEYPTDNCIERLKLAGGAGWISVRLNKPPPLDEPLVEVVGIDETFDANDPGSYHLKAQTEVMNQLGGAAVSSGGPPNSLVSQAARRLMTTMSTAELSSIHVDEDDDGEEDVDEDVGNSVSYQGSGITLFRNGMGGGALAMAPPGHEICLICLTENRDATIVHGGTGHIATCLGCARILKARGDNCPVCRLPIDTVIQQFWA